MIRKTIAELEQKVRECDKAWERARENAERDRKSQTWTFSSRKLYEDECMYAYDAYQKAKAELEAAIELEEQDRLNCIQLGAKIEILTVTLEKIKWLTEEVYGGVDTLKGRITLNNMMEAHRHADDVLYLLGGVKDDNARKRVRDTLQRMRDADDSPRFPNADPSAARVLSETDPEPSEPDQVL